MVTLEVTNSKTLPYLDSNFLLKAQPLDTVTKGRSGGGDGGTGGTPPLRNLNRKKSHTL